MDLKEELSFGIIDYSVFGVMLLCSLGIGIFMSFKGNKSPEDYLMGSRSFGPIPIAMSLITSIVSAISVLGYSGEAYAHGLQISLLVIGTIFGILLSSILTLPVFFPLKLTSVNEYIELRFKSPRLRGCVTIISCVQGLLYMGVCLYAPTVALASITPFSSLFYIFVLGATCAIYSTIGGMRAVVWTDVFQLTVMVIGLFVVAVFGCIEVGGIGKVWSIATEGGRTDVFNMSVSIYERHTFYNSLLFGFAFFASIYCTSQMNVQRICSVSSLKDAKKMLLLNVIGMPFIYVLIFLNGLIVYASYYGCDPLLMGKIKKKEEILAYYVADRLGHITGLPGLFVALLVGGTLSSLSSVISGQVAMIWKDCCKFVKIFANASPKASAMINKILSLLIGLSLIGMAILTSHTVNLIQLAMTIGSIVMGPIFGIFLLGLLFPKCNVVGVWCGFFVSAFFLCWASFGAYLYADPPQLLPFSIEACNSTVLNYAINSSMVLSNNYQNSSIANNISSVEDLTAMSRNNFFLMNLYSISYTLYPVLGPMICVVIGMIVSYITGLEDPDNVPPELAATFIRKYYWKDEQYGKLDHKNLQLLLYDFPIKKYRRGKRMESNS